MLDLIIDFDKEPDKLRLYNVLKGLKGKNVIQIKKWRKARSINQHKYLFGVVYRYVGQEIGLTTEEAHQTMKEHFLSYEKRLPNGTVAKFTKSTTDLDTLEMTAFIEQIRTFMLEQFSCLIPDPEQSIY
jgi:hypothetical protein